MAFQGNAYNPLTSASSVPVLPVSEGAPFDAVTGPGFLQTIGAASNCPVGGPVYFAHTSCARTTNQSTTFTFTIAGGATNAAYDLYATVRLPSPTNTLWVWLGQGYSGYTYQLTNQYKGGTFYILGTPQDSDADGLTDSYEKLVSHTDPNNPDTAYDSLGDGWDVVFGLNPPCAR